MIFNLLIAGKNFPYSIIQFQHTCIAVKRQKIRFTNALVYVCVCASALFSSLWQPSIHCMNLTFSAQRIMTFSSLISINKTYLFSFYTWNWLIRQITYLLVRIASDVVFFVFFHLCSRFSSTLIGEWNRFCVLARFHLVDCVNLIVLSRENGCNFW